AASYAEPSTPKTSAFQPAPGHQRCPAACIEIAGHESSARFQIGENGNTRTDAIEIVNGKRNLRFVGDGPQMQNGVRGTTGGCDARNGIFDGLFCDDF